MSDEIIERLDGRERLARLCDKDFPEDAAAIRGRFGTWIPTYIALEALSQLEDEAKRLREHIEEQIQHVEQRIKDGIEMGASVWRIALEDIARENRTALNPPHVSSLYVEGEGGADG
jgi:hypothetical protein